MPRFSNRLTPGIGPEYVSLLAAVACIAALGFVAYMGSVPLASVGLVVVFLGILCLHSTLVAAGLLVGCMLFSPEWVPAPGLRIRGEDIVIPLLVLSLAARACIPRLRLRFRWSRLDAAIFALLGVNLLASLRGAMSGTVDPRLSLFWNGKIAELFLVYWVIFNYVREPRQVRPLVGAAVVVLIGITVYTYFQIPHTEIHSAHRLSAPFEGQPEPTTLGGYLTLLLAVVMARAIYEPRRARRVAFWVLSLMVLVSVLFTLSRTTYITCAVMVVCLALVTRHWSLLCTAIVAGLASPVLMPAKVVQRVLMTFDSTRAYSLDPSLAERVFVWRKALNTLRHRPLLGYGVPQGIVDSQFVRIIVESGLLGLAAWTAVIVCCFLMGRRLHRRAREPLHRAVGAAYMVGVVALSVHALATITFYIVRIMEPFWFLTGIVASLNAHYRETGGEDTG